MPAVYPRRFRYAWVDPETQEHGVGPWKDIDLYEAAKLCDSMRAEFPNCVIMLEREDQFIWRGKGWLGMREAGALLAKLTPRQLEVLEKFMEGGTLTGTERLHKQSIMRMFDCHGDQLHRIYYPGILAEYRGIVKLRRRKHKHETRKEG